MFLELLMLIININGNFITHCSSSLKQLIRVFYQLIKQQENYCSPIQNIKHTTQIHRYNISDQMQTEESVQAKLIQDHPHTGSIFSQKTLVELGYQIQISAKIKKQPNKTILHPQQGIIPAESFTAILGPSGSGKTTFLNFLAGRLMSDNLILQGHISINGVNIRNMDQYSNQIGYVMQEDALLGMLTPKECFMFAADLKLAISKEEKKNRVEDLIQELGLKDCCNVKIGNTFIKGVSGGQRKRTSIGIELITNPKIIFLDEPTTGLDSTTALQVIQLLGSLSKKGRTIISTIHQPSSELFCQFDRLMLLVEGRCIYSGGAENSYGYFEKMGYKCPELMNASQFYLDLMSLQIEEEDTDEIYAEKRAQFEKNITKMQQNYKESQFANLKQNTSLMPLEIQKRKGISIFYELWLIFFRSLLCQIRNPMDLGLKIIQSIFTSLIVLVVFGKIDNQRFENVRGVAFFLVSSNAFGGIQGTLATFSLERPVFIRERFSKTYSSVIYFLGRTMCSFPFDLIYPTIGVSIIYWATGLGAQTGQQFVKLICVVNCAYFLSASYGLLYSTIIPKLETAMALVPVLIIPFMLLGGFFINLDSVHDIRVVFYPIMYLSPFKYGYQSNMSVLYGSELKQKFTPQSYQDNILVMTGIAIGVRLISLIAMQIVSTPKRPKLKPTAVEESM